MAFHGSSLLLFLAVVFMAAAPLANSVLYNGHNIAGISVRGRIQCTSTGNPTGPLCVGVPVVLTSINSPRVLGHGITGSDGVFDIIITDLTTLVLGAILPCYATAQLPVAGCAALSTRSGAIRAQVSLTSSFVQASIGLCIVAQVGVWVAV